MYHSIIKLLHSKPSNLDETSVTLQRLELFERWLIELLCEIDYLKSCQILTPEQDKYLTQHGETAKSQYLQLSQAYYHRITK